MDKEILIGGVIIIGIGIAAYFLLHSVTDTANAATKDVSDLANQAANLPATVITSTANAVGGVVAGAASGIASGFTSLESLLGFGGN
jgi:hypothetical protein